MTDETAPAWTTFYIFGQQCRVEFLPERAAQNSDEKCFVDRRRGAVSSQLTVALVKQSQALLRESVNVSRFCNRFSHFTFHERQKKGLLIKLQCRHFRQIWMLCRF